MEKIKLIAIAGKAGTGKDTLLNSIVNSLYSYLPVHKVVSYTTRPMREREVDGVDYNFITIEEFTKKVIDGSMLEAVSFNGWFYGTAVESFNSNPGAINLGIFNPEGLETLMGYSEIEMSAFLLTADPKVRLLRQLNREDNPNIDEIVRRYKTDEEDFCDIEDLNLSWLYNNQESSFKSCKMVIIDKIKSMSGQNFIITD